MTPETCAKASASAVAHLASGFMLEPELYAKGAELGYPGMSFYFTGRCGVLGPVDADVVSASLGFFNPETVRQNWDPYLDRDLHKATLDFIAAGHAWAQRFPEDLDVARLAELCGKVIDGASPCGAPLFAAWRHVDETDEPKGLALQRMQVLRELRGNLHAAAVLAVGLTPLEALMTKTPHMAPIFGWTADLPDPGDKDAHKEADRLTNAMTSHAFAVLTDDEREDFVTLARAALASAS